ncbi:unnamed protein product [Discula destructiva]
MAVITQTTDGDSIYPKMIKEASTSTSSASMTATLIANDEGKVIASKQPLLQSRPVGKDEVIFKSTPDFLKSAGFLPTAPVENGKDKEQDNPSMGPTLHPSTAKRGQQAMLEPTTLVLVGKGIFSKAGTSEQQLQYFLTRDIQLEPRSKGSPVHLAAFEAFDADPRRLYAIKRVPRRPKQPKTYSLTAAPTNHTTPQGIRLRQPTPSPAKAFIHLEPQCSPRGRKSTSATAEALRAPEAKMLVTCVKKTMPAQGYKYFTSDEDGYSAGPLAVARESIHKGKRELQITYPMSQHARDWLVAIWCLRVWRETIEAKSDKRLLLAARRKLERERAAERAHSVARHEQARENFVEEEPDVAVQKRVEDLSRHRNSLEIQQLNGADVGTQASPPPPFATGRPQRQRQRRLPACLEDYNVGMET